jgi:hypothetical protein
MAEPTGLEPAISGVTVQYVNQLHHGSECSLTGKPGLEPPQTIAYSRGESGAVRGLPKPRILAPDRILRHLSAPPNLVHDTRG